MKSKTIILLTAASLAAVSSSPAAVTLYAEYLLGETGSLGTNNRPNDSSGNNRHFTGNTSGTSTSTTSVLTTGVFAPGSTAYLSTAGTGSEGWFGADLSLLATDNFAFGIYVRSFENTAATRGNAFVTGGVNGAFGVGLASNGWSAGAFGVSWIGPTNGVTGSFVANTWTHLAVIRSGGTATFYINGAAQTGTFATAPVHGQGHLSVDPGGNTFFDGEMDNARVVTFTAGESASNVINALQVPEPTSALLVGLGGLGLLLRRRR